MRLEDRYDTVLERIARAAERAGRPADDVTLVAVSKSLPASAVLELASLGHTDFGENKVQELTDKAGEIGPSDAVRWHMIGHLQRNKAKDVVGLVGLFHALDSVRLGRTLQARLEREDERLGCLVQVNISGENSKFGVPAARLEAVLDELLKFDRLRLRGLMTLATPVDNSEDVRPEFKAMRRLSEVVADRLETGGKGPLLSMGMSNDFEVAVEEGATHVRIGSAIFGPRSYPGG